VRVPQLWIGFAVGLLIGVGGAWLVVRQLGTPSAVYCEVSLSTAASRGLDAGALVDGTDSGCAPSEVKFCVSSVGSVLHLRRC